MSSDWPSYSRAELARAIDITCQMGCPEKAELLRAVCSGDIVLAEVASRRAKLDTRLLTKAKRPVLILVGDDDALPTGPSGWRCARFATAWAAAAVVHGAGAEPEHYREAVQAAIATGRGLLVETSSQHAPAWAAMLRGKPVLEIRPESGVHPVPMRRGDLH